MLHILPSILQNILTDRVCLIRPFFYVSLNMSGHGVPGGSVGTPDRSSDVRDVYVEARKNRNGSRVPVNEPTTPGQECSWVIPYCDRTPRSKHRRLIDLGLIKVLFGMVFGLGLFFFQDQISV